MLQKGLTQVLDIVFEVIPQDLPEKSLLENVKIVAHRGLRDNIDILENTFPAYDPLLAAEIWGIEFDVRWTKDLVPIIFHDQDGSRVMNRDLIISQLTFKEMREAMPLIPTLEEILDRYHKKFHFMIEIKTEFYPDEKKQKDILQGILSSMTPIDDFHILTIDPDTYRHVDFLPSKALLPVAELDFAKWSKIAIEKNYAGISGHFYLLDEKINAAHMAHDQKLGTGFIKSANCLSRELNRGVEWMFTNDPLDLNEIRKDLLKKL